MKKYENKREVFTANYDKTVDQLIRRFPEVVSLVNDWNGNSSAKRPSFMGNLATIEEYANKAAFATVDSFHHVKAGLRQNLRLGFEN